MGKPQVPVCAKCVKRTCMYFGLPDSSLDVDTAPDFCPMKTDSDLLAEALKEYGKADIKQLACSSSRQEAQCYEHVEGGLRTKIPRVEETIQFAKKMNYQKLGLVFCIGLINEAQILGKMLESNGFEVASVCCKTGSLSTDEVGLPRDETIMGPAVYSTMCNPIGQAFLMNRSMPDWVIMMGLCVGHDTLFLKYCERPVTVLAVKDRVFGHNPMAGIYLSGSVYYMRLLSAKI